MTTNKYERTIIIEKCKLLAVLTSVQKLFAGTSNFFIQYENANIFDCFIKDANFSQRLQ